jgi:23S rRNA (guanosine2251-2'-O)-methyltransferase
MKKEFKKDFRSHRGPSQSPSAPRGSGGNVVQIPKNWRVVIGFHAIREAFSVHAKHIETAWFKQGYESSQELKELAKELKAGGVKIEEKALAILDKMYPSHQGAALFLSKTPEINWKKLETSTESVVLVLDGLEDPHNLGAILRTSWLMNVDGVLAPEDRAAGLTSTVHKVACGGAEHVPVERVGSFAKPLEQLKKDGYWVFGLSHLGERTLFDLKIPEKVVWCIGSEEKGLRSTTERLCDELVRIPQVSAAASYNASVATAIALTETLRTRPRVHKSSTSKND